MEGEVLKLALNQGLGYALFVFLLLYVLKTTGERESKYQSTIEKNQSIIKELAENLNVVEDVKRDVEEIKQYFK